VKKEFKDGKNIAFSANTTVQLYPIILLGGGNMEWVSCAIGKESMAVQHCNHCKPSQKDFVKGLGEPWTIKKARMQLTIIETSFFQLLLTYLQNWQGIWV
jgi:hypothetical protein